MSNSERSLQDRLRQMLDKSDISEALVRYCRACDRHDMGLMQQAFHSDATISQGYYVGSAAGFIERFVRLGDPSSSPISRLQHRVSNILCQLDGEFADVESYFEVFRRRQSGDAQSVDEILVSRVLDRFERREHRWAIVRREVIWDWAAGWPAQPAFWESEPGQYSIGRRDDEDASCRVFPKTKFGN